MGDSTWRSSKKLYTHVESQLRSFYSDEEATALSKMLLEDLGLNFEQVLIDKEIQLTSALHRRLHDHLELLKAFHPIQYVLGKAHFFGREFIVNNHVLIPRQETEELVNEVLVDNMRAGLKILDIGSGSGCIGITLGLELKTSTVTLLDVDPEAMDVARENASLLGLDIDIILDDALKMDRLPGKYDIIVSNPPYVTDNERAKMSNNVLQHEPALALFVPDHEPLLFYEKIVVLAKIHLAEGGKLYFEINERFGSELVKLCEEEGCTYVDLVKDLNGKDRIIKARFD